MEPDNDAEAPARSSFEGRRYRRRGKHRHAVATLFGTVDVWRRLYEPLEQGVRSFHPLERRLGREAKSDHTTLAHWQRVQGHNIGVIRSSSVRISSGLI